LPGSAGRCTGARIIALDGEPVEGNVLPLQPGGLQQIKVII
jgi:hypothetical protein